ncbi:hypothetical protein FRC10_003280 [Ceratobasidium sp. 414]|nr:hypothetical protein FRC10_003280 [Ceratobasidium sp. 414]
MPTADKLDPRSSIFKTSELVVLICGFLDPEQCLPLLTTSRLCFLIAASRVWEKVDNARVLLKLIQTKSLHTPCYLDFKDEAVIVSFYWWGGVVNDYNDSLLQNLDDPVNFQRFDVYAPLVKHLDVYGRARKHFKVTAWHTLLRRTHERPLLPNLLSLTLHASNSRFAIDQVLWVSAFASPSLVQFTPVHVRNSDNCLVSDSTASTILKTLNERCPSIKSLALYCRMWDDSGGAGEESCCLNLGRDGHFLQRLQLLVNLRELSVSLSTISGDGLLVLGKLPQLKSLAIYGYSDDLEEENLSVPDDSFPQLTNLTLGEIYVHTIAYLMAVEPLTRNLVTLSLCHWFDDEAAGEEAIWFSEAVPSLLSHTRCLKHFYYDATYSVSSLPLDFSNCVLSHNLLRRTSELGLDSIFMTGFNFASTETLESIPKSWSTLTTLCLTHAIISPTKLPYFAQLPRLQSLTVLLPLGSGMHWPVFDGYDVGLALHTLETTHDKLQIIAVAVAKPASRILAGCSGKPSSASTSPRFWVS